MLPCPACLLPLHSLRRQQRPLAPDVAGRQGDQADPRRPLVLRLLQLPLRCHAARLLLARQGYPYALRTEAFEGRDEGLAYLFSFVGRPHMVPQRKYQRHFLSLSAVYGAILDAARLVVGDSAGDSVSE